ncbi:DNA damage-regulated autophagy modulator protein 1-like [Dendrobates tinctorius]|uniref:DNA damage-regulated autophagy modulator protein 1-like n=1 Tax=Dendrobates tinctorius TaxID=92724 RepID=UPI003CC9D31E
MTITEGHYLTPYISISDTGAEFPESIVMTVVSTVSALLDAAIMYVMYRLYVIRKAKRTRTGDILQKVLLAVGWLSCVGSIISTYLQDFTVSDYINIVVLLCSAPHTIFLTDLPAAESKNGQCIVITWMILSVLQFLAFVSSSNHKIEEKPKGRLDYPQR